MVALMASNFDKKNDEQLYEDTFQNAAALYAVLKAEGTPRSPRRAELKQGEVTAEAIDFLADFELKARRVLNPMQYKLVLRYTVEDRYQSIPKGLQQDLGMIFLKSNMDSSGDYRSLYFRAKNNRLQDRDEPQHFVEEVTNE